MSYTPDMLAELPPDVLNNIPALQPPAGVQSNFVDPESRGNVLVIVATISFCLMTLFYFNRMYTKVLIIRKLGWDDFTCTVGFLGSIVLYIVNVWGTTEGPFGKHQWDVRLVDFMKDSFTMPGYLTPILTPLNLCFIKLTFFLLYLQVFRPLRWLRISVYFGGTITAAFYGSATIAQIIFTTKRPGESWFAHFTTPMERKANILSVPLSAVGLGIDIVLLAMPIAAVMGLQLPKKRKIGIMCIFMFGLLACIGSILSIYYRVVANRSKDQTWNVMPVELMALIEMNIGILCVSLPAFSKMLHHHLPPLETMRSLLYARFSSLRSSKSEAMASHTRYSHSNGQGQSTPIGPYAHVRDQSSPSRDFGVRPSYELGQMKSVQTFIGRGREVEASDDKIHLTHEIKQQQAKVDQRSLGSQ